LLAFELNSGLIIKRLFTTRAISKSDYVDKSLTYNIKSQLNSKKWITIKQKKLLKQYIEKCQTNLSALTINSKNSLSETFYIIELLLNSLLFQVYATEVFSLNKTSKLAGVDGKTLNNNDQGKLKYLRKLKNFRKLKPSLLKKAYIFNKSGENLSVNIPCVLDRLVQQLFALALDPIIEANSDIHSYGFRKGRNFVMAVGDIQKSFQNKILKKSFDLKPTFIWKVCVAEYSSLINHKWLLKNVPLPFKYRYILKSWLKFGHIKFKTIKTLENHTFPIEILTPLLMNFALNGIERLIHEETTSYQKVMARNYLKT